MSKGKFKRSVAKCIRRQKAIIRSQNKEPEELNRLINELIARHNPLK